MGCPSIIPTGGQTSPITPGSRTSASSSYRDTMSEITNGAVTRTCREHRGLYVKKISSNKLGPCLFYISFSVVCGGQLFVNVVRGAMYFASKNINPYTDLHLLVLGDYLYMQVWYHLHVKTLTKCMSCTIVWVFCSQYINQISGIFLIDLRI